MKTEAMTALDNIKTARDMASDLVAAIKVENITITEARILIGLIRETEGWLASAKILLDPTAEL